MNEDDPKQRHALNYAAMPTAQKKLGFSYRRERGTLSLAIAALAVAVFWICVLLPNLSEKFARNMLFVVDSLFFVGGVVAVFGTDNDRQKTFAYVGMFLNFALLLAGLFFTLVSYFVMTGF